MDVYVIENLVNGKRYVGKTTQTTHARWREHRTEARIGRKHTPLLEAIREHGADNFKVTTLACRDSQDKLGACERRYIKDFETDDPDKGYNVQGGGGGCTRKPIRAATSGLTDTHRQRIRRSLIAYHQTRKANSADLHPPF